MNRSSLLKSMLLIASTFIFVSFSAQGQNRPDHHPKNPETVAISVNNGSFAANLRNEKIPATAVTDHLPEWLGLPDGYTFVAAEKSEDALGFTHERYQEYYRGVPVAEGMALVHSRNGMITAVNGQMATVDPKATTRPVIGSETARNIAKAALEIDREIAAYAPAVVFTTPPQAGNARLAWKLRLDGMTTAKKVKMAHVFVDATTGKVIRIVPLIMEGDVTATAKTLYSGDRTITSDSYSGGYRLIDNARNIETYNVGGEQPNVSNPSLPFFPNPKQYTNTTTTWGKIPMFMSMTLETASAGFISGIGSSYLLASFIGMQSGGSMNMLTMNPLYSFSGANSLPATTQKMYVPLDAGATYASGYLKLDFQNNQMNVIDQIMFDVADMSVGTHPWLDQSSGASGTYTVALVKNPALDAHWGIEMTHDFYMQAFNRNSYDGAGAVLRNYINGMFVTAGTQTNASALPEPYNSMIYGLGDGEMMGPMVALDITAHEFTHLVTGHTSNLDYFGESGALNESFSDMMGTSIEFFARPEDANWLIGEDVLLNGAAALRSMADPNQSGPAQPDTYNGQYWASTNPSSFDNGGVHINSGVGNYWFYLLTNGGSGTNDISDYYNVHGIGMEKAQQIAYRTWVFYLTSSAQYLDAYNASLEATTDLYGINSQEYQSVRQAWYAVGIGDSATAPPTAIQEQEQWQANIELYPNPNNGIFYVDNSFQQPVTATVRTLTGVAVKTLALQAGKNTVDLSALSKGIYFVRFSAEGKATFTHKIVIR